MAVGEVGVRNLRRLARYYGQDDELQLSFNFHFLEQPWRAERFRALVERWEALLPAPSWPDYTLSNHDRSRAATRHGLERAGVAAAMLLTLRGTPFLYYGEEIGMTDVAIPPDRVRDIDGRDGERTPMQWDGTEKAGFSTSEPWLPLPLDYRERNVAAQRDDPTSLFSLYRRLIRLRKASVALRRGSYRTLRSPRGVYAYAREDDGERMLVALNFTNATREISFGAGDARVRFSTDPRRDGERAALSRLVLTPNEGLVVAE